MSFVFDTSALLTKLYGEPGVARVDAVLLNEHCLMSAVNLVEFAGKCSDQGMAREDVEIVLGGFDIEIVEFDADLALSAGALRAVTRHLGLSLGDRACLALAQKLGVAALTADRAWLELDLGIAVECVR